MGNLGYIKKVLIFEEVIDDRNDLKNEMHENKLFTSTEDSVTFSLFLHAFNIFDTEYIQDSLDNSPYNGFSDTHTASDAEVFMGMPRFIIGGLQILY